ncbi:hypothetical protein FOL47_009016 [Perkinsus chesapeaki]|uniref:PIH1 N-terminal domain-containing protein n=1 Tax=Perkinsus chesapeaki TaxID=330153 RepID=A0A7J6LB92_PERCH|nr:hypothetical protein FOL47_009016 [Perkinsus chesapeaki]
MSASSNYPSSAVPSGGLNNLPRPALIPLPGLAVKTTCILHQRPNASTKLFVNICGHPLVEGPLLPSGARADGHLVDKMGIKNMQVPVDVGSFRRVFDHSGNSCAAVDVVFTPWLVSKAADCVPAIQKREKIDDARQSLVLDLLGVAFRNVQGFVKPIREVHTRGWKFLKASYKFLDEQTNKPVDFEPADEQADNTGSDEAAQRDVVEEDQGSKLIEVVSDNSQPSRKSRNILKKGFLNDTKGALYGESGSTEGILPENAGDPMGWLPKKLRQSCKIVDTANVATESALPATTLHSEQSEMQKELEEIFNKHSYNSMWSEDKPQAEEQAKPEAPRDPEVTMETVDGKLICTVPVPEETDVASFDIELSTLAIRIEGKEYPIPARVDETAAKAKFSKKRHVITLTAPLV